MPSPERWPYRLTQLSQASLIIISPVRAEAIRCLKALRPDIDLIGGSGNFILLPQPFSNDAFAHDAAT